MKLWSANRWVYVVAAMTVACGVTKTPVGVNQKPAEKVRSEVDSGSTAPSATAPSGGFSLPTNAALVDAA